MNLSLHGVKLIWRKDSRLHFYKGLHAYDCVIFSERKSVNPNAHGALAYFSKTDPIKMVSKYLRGAMYY